jgi:hypothetical protein
MENESMNEHIDDLLLEGDQVSMRAAAEHAATCASCAETLASWNEMSSTAKSLHATWQSDMLLPRIQRAVREEKQTSRRRFAQIAAAILITVGAGTGVWHIVDQRQDEKAFRQRILQESAVDQVEQAEKAHLAAIDQLAKIADPKLEDAHSPLMVNYKEKLVLIDDAIAECEANIQHNRQNAHLRRQLLAMYSEKQKTLQDVVRESSNVSNQ